MVQFAITLSAISGFVAMSVTIAGVSGALGNLKQSQIVKIIRSWRDFAKLERG
jgi:hypothetical protein